MKKIKLLSLTLIMLMFFSAQSISQEIKGKVGHADVGIVMSMDEIVQYDLLHPSDSTPKLKEPRNPNWKYPEFPVDESKIIYTYDKKWEPNPSNAPKDPSPTPDDDFLGLGDDGTSIPPDVNGCAGPNHVMITLNTQVRIQSKTGTVISTVSLSNFFNGLPGSGGTFDPRIKFDPYANRWIVACVAGSSSTSSNLFIAVSETDDPTGNWYKTSIDTDPANSGWMDYPNLGFNKKWIVLSGNMFSNGGNFQKNVFFVVKKSDLYNGFPNAQYTRITYNPSFTIVPSVTYDPDLEDIYLLSNYSSGFLGKYKISGDIGSEVFSFEGFISAGSSISWASGAPGGIDFSPQLGSTHKINSGDARMQNVIYRNGKLWAAHHVFLPASNPNRSVIQWWELDALANSVLQFGRIDESGMHFTYPCIAVNALEEVLIGYSSFSSSQYASASYSFRTPDDPLNTMEDRYQFKDGLSPYYKTFGGARNRWGDYTATYVDPSNDLDFWSLQEYAASPSNTWGTWWAMLNRDAAPLPEFFANQVITPVGGSVNFTDASTFGPETWAWTFEGGTPGSSDEQNPENIVYNTAGVYDVSLTVTNAAGSNTMTKTDYIEVSEDIVPDVAFMATDLAPCVGTPTQLIDQSLYNPISWEWAISPGTFDYVDGSNATSQNPSVQFNQAGLYTVGLTATNSNGSGTLTQTDYISAGGYQMPFTEDFESDLVETGWTVDNPDGGITWETKNVGGNEPGSLAAFIDLKAYQSLGDRDGLISPPLNFTGYIGIVLNFQHAYAQRVSVSSDSLNVYYSTDCGENWVQVFGINEDGNGSFATHEALAQISFVPGDESDWCSGGFGPDCYSIDLSNLQWHNNVRIKFESVTGYGNALYLDNMSFDLTTGMPDNAASKDKIQIFPNPSNGEIVVNISELENTADLEVLGITGKLIKKRTLQPNSSGLNTTIDLSNQPKGVYFIHIYNGEYNHVEKVVLK